VARDVPHPRSRLWQRGVALAVCWLVAVFSTVPVLAAPGASGDDKFTLTADRVEYNAQTRIGRADGHARVAGRDVVITADHIEANAVTQDVVATGHVTLTRGDTKATGSSLRYNLRTQQGRVEEMTGESPPWHLTADAIEIDPKRQVAYGASITSCDPARPVYLVTAKKIEIVPNDHFTAYDASLWVAGVRVITLPEYTTALGRPSGPGLGINNPDGVYFEYKNSFYVGEFLDEYRIRYGTTSGLSAENTLSEKFSDHVIALHLGRAQPYDSGGTLVNVDRFSVDVEYDRIKIRDTPWNFQVEAHAGSYGELATGVSTTRVEGILYLSSDTFMLSPSLALSLSGQVRFDAYGTGQQRTVMGAAAALSVPVGDRGGATLSYGFNTPTGASPFSFDQIGPSNSIALNYGYSFGGGFLQALSTFLNYDFLAQQYVFNLSLAMRVTDDTLFNVSAWYNLTTRQLTEVDYAINQRCDCVAIGLLYRTYPQSPAANTFLVTMTINAFPGRGFSFSGSGATYTSPP
jgi:hypothetical protein